MDQYQRHSPRNLIKTNQNKIKYHSMVGFDLYPSHSSQSISKRAVTCESMGR